MPDTPAAGPATAGQPTNQPAARQPQAPQKEPVAVLETTHVQLANRRSAVGAMRYAVHNEAAHPADAFAAIGVERDWFLSASDQSLIENVEHFEKRRVRRNVMHFVIDEFALRLSIFLAPDFEFEIHIFTSS